MDNEELIQSFRTMIEELQSSQKELKDQLDGILKEADDARRSYDKEQFIDRNKDFFDKYRDDVKAVEGDDFDFDEVAYSGKGDMDEAEYIAALSSKLDEQLNAMAKRLSHLTGEKIEAVEAKAEDVDGDGETDTTEVKAEPESETKDEVKEDVKAEVEEKPEDEDEEKSVKNEEMSDDFKRRFSAMY